MSESTGTAYVIVLGVNVIIFSPSILAVFKSDFEKRKSPCNIPEIFNFLSSLKAIFNLLASSPLWFFLISDDV